MWMVFYIFYHIQYILLFGVIMIVTFSTLKLLRFTLFRSSDHIVYLVTWNVLFLFPFLGPSCLLNWSSCGSTLLQSSGTSSTSGTAEVAAFCCSASSSSYTTVSSLSSDLGGLSMSTGIVCFSVVPLSAPGFLLATCAANLVADGVEGTGADGVEGTSEI